MSETIYQVSCDCGIPQVETIEELCEMTSEMYEESEATNTSSLLEMVDRWMKALEASGRRVELMENAMVNLRTSMERLLDEIVSTRLEVDETFPPPETNLADTPPYHPEDLARRNQVHN